MQRCFWIFHHHNRLASSSYSLSHIKFCESVTHTHTQNTRNANAPIVVSCDVSEIYPIPIYTQPHPSLFPPLFLWAAVAVADLLTLLSYPNPNPFDFVLGKVVVIAFSLLNNCYYSSQLSLPNCSEIGNGGPEESIRRFRCRCVGYERH